MDYQDVTLAQLTNLDNIRMLADHGYALYGLKVGDPGTQIWARPRPVAAVAPPAPAPAPTTEPDAQPSDNDNESIPNAPTAPEAEVITPEVVQ